MGTSEATKEWWSLAVHLAESSGEIVRRYFRSGLSAEEKSDGTLISIADREAEQCIRGILEREVPDHGILGEELGQTLPDARYQWVIDPIDGTKSFLSGSFDFGTLIALLDAGVPILGVIHQPVLREMFMGDGEKTELNGKRVGVRSCANLADAVLLATDLLSVGHFRDGGSFARLTEKVAFCRTWGNCCGYGLVASGFADIMIDPIMSRWDIMALIPVMRGAGAVITDYFGNDPVVADSIVATVPELHGTVIQILGSEADKRVSVLADESVHAAGPRSGPGIPPAAATTKRGDAAPDEDL